MGQAANDLINGFVCSECGIYFAEPHGYPVLCHGCHEQTTPEQRAILPEAREPELGTD